MKIEKSVLALIAFVAVFFAVLAEARLENRRFQNTYDGVQDVHDDMFDLDDDMFDQQTRYVKQSAKGRYNRNGYTVRKSLQGGKDVRGVPARDRGNWVQQKSYGEGKGGSHFYKAPNFNSKTKTVGAIGRGGGSGRTRSAGGRRGGRGRDEMSDDMFDQDDEF